MDPIEVRLIKEIHKSENGLSMWDAHKLLDVSRDICSYRLEKLKKMGVLEKNGSKYSLSEDIGKFTIVDGVAVVEREGTVTFLNCPYFGIDCECKRVKAKDCKLIKSLPYELGKEVLGKIGKETELHKVESNV